MIYILDTVLESKTQAKPSIQQTLLKKYNNAYNITSAC